MNRQMNSELFSFVIRNAKKESDITIDIQKILNQKTLQITRSDLVENYVEIFIYVFLLFLTFLIRLICYLYLFETYILFEFNLF